ncbi:hypothetical protein GWK47_024228 [Chionoecetes opilio]|uniref:Peptidase A2 domain-containing protein n=1 Tax=Chionoecetes opilio TaxID=41210 RepID=A0A8J4XVK8_CHIOP|nr:hypothetical protein GWK47_024228 [Chionoecetes opilio]
MPNPPDPCISPPDSLHRFSRAPPPRVNPPQSLVSPARSPAQSPAAHPPPSPPFPGRRTLLWVADTLSGMRYLVDSGAEVSVVPPSSDERLAQPSTAYDLLAANNTPIATYGTRTLRLSLTPTSPFVWSFVVTEVDQLGCGFPLFP